MGKQNRQQRSPDGLRPGEQQADDTWRVAHSGRGAASALRQLLKWERRRAEDRATKGLDKPSRG